ncbi:MAG: preprotein translocase subunit SecE [Eubacteriales bacterium]|nr:preprotein translocase subunit SecE [Eubacteriales bacterium]
MAKNTKKDAARRPFFLVRWFIAIKDYIAGSIKELKKVTWPTRKELIKSTWVVLVLVVIIAALTFGFDTLFDIITGWAYDLV